MFTFFNDPEWAKGEVEKAIAAEKRLTFDNQGDDDTEDLLEISDYLCKPYEIALKAYMALAEGGEEFAFPAMQILNRLMCGKPLATIYDVPETWNVGCVRPENGQTTYQCKRAPDIFKIVDVYGNVKYFDADRCECRNRAEPQHLYESELASDILDKLYPVTMPYYPSSEPFIFDCEEFPIEDSGPYTRMIAFYSLQTPNGETVTIELYYAQKEDFTWATVPKDIFEQEKKEYERRSNA